MMRSVPCIAGWDGPMLMSIVSGRASRWTRVSISVLERDAGLLLAPGVALAQGMALEPFVHQDPPQVGMAGEGHSEHIEHLALQPVGVLPQAGQGIHGRVVAGERALDPEPAVA